MSKLLLTLGIIFSLSCNAQKVSNADLAKQFVTYIKNNDDITDSTHLKYILLHYIFVDRRLDSTNADRLQPGELTDVQLGSLKKQLRAFSDFLQKNKTLDIIPARSVSDPYIYNHFTAFQKENTIALINKGSKDAIAYILFVPPMERVLSTPRIWSWTLTFQFGKYMFRSVTGEDGYEYIFN